MSGAAPLRAPARALTLAIPAIFVIVFGVFLLRKGDSDWDQMLSFHQIELWNAKLFGLEKQWNPLMAGGMSLAGDPQVPVLSPSMLLSRVLPPAAAIKIAALFFVGIGWMGAFLLARQVGLDSPTCALAASLFAGNGYILSHLSHGHTGFLGTLSLPLFLWASRATLRAPGESFAGRARRFLALVLAGGVLFAISIDGEPMSVLLLLVWVGLDAALLAWRRRSPAPLLLFAGALGVASGLDAVFLFPMVVNQAVFPRWKAPVFLDPLLFFWFLILPTRGKVLPAPANGHEFSVYVGPILAYLLVRYRGRIARAFSAEERRTCIVASAAMFLIGLGAFRALGSWLPPGPFDVLHLLPGFRTVGIPARFWGYLALPLALAGAVAIRGLEADTSPARPHRALWTLLLLSILLFETVTLAEPFVTAQGRRRVATVPLPREIRSITNLEGPIVSQALELKPSVGILEAYNLHDYVQGAIAPGAELVRQAIAAGGGALVTRAAWDGWNRIAVTLPQGGGPGTIVFNQNFHPRWRSSAGAAARDARGNLVLRLPRAVEPGATVTMRFSDDWSILGGRISRVSAILLLAAAAGLAAAEAVSRRARRSVAGESVVGSVQDEPLG